MVKIVYNRLLGGWLAVRGPHQTPLSGVFPTKAAAKASLGAAQAARDARMPAARYVTGDGRRFVDRDNALAYADRVHRQTGNIIAVEEIR
jgi:hypothetical protein